MVVLCSIGEGEAGLYRLDGVLRSVTDDDGDHGAPDDQRRGRGHGEVQGAQSVVMQLAEQQTVVKNSWSGHAPVTVHGDGRRAARRL